MATVVSENLKIEIRPVGNHGNIEKFSKDMSFFAQPNSIPPLVDPKTLKYVTGLSKEDVKYLKDNKFPYPFENDVFVLGQANPFWDGQAVKVALSQKPTFLYPGKSIFDFIKYKWLCESPYVYKNETEMLTGNKPAATHFIYNESQEINSKAVLLEVIEGIKLDISKLSTDRKKNVIFLVTGETIGTKDAGWVAVRLDSIYSNEEEFERLKEVLAWDAETQDLRHTVKLAIAKNILLKSINGIRYYETILGHSEDEAVAVLKNNQELLLTIKSKI